MVDAVLVFEKRQDRKQARALERRHAEVLRLKRKRQPNARVAKIAAEFGIERQPRPQERQHLEQRPTQHRSPAQKRIFEDGLKSAQLVRDCRRESGESASHRPGRTLRSPVPSVRRRAWQACRRRRRRRGGTADRAAPSALRRRNRGRWPRRFVRSDKREQKERRAEVEAEAAALRARRAPADASGSLEDRDIEPGSSEQERTRQSARARRRR